jgi:hypothetical protein
LSNRPSKKRSSSARVQAASRAGQGGNRAWIFGIAAIVVVGVALIAAIAIGNSGSSSSNGNITGRKAAPAAVVTGVAKVPSTVTEKVGAGTTLALPKPINGKPIEQNGKPGVLYIGAEYCPYCATERWALTNALSRFGTWSNLQITNSSLQDTNPGTKTLSFHGAKLTSPYLVFSGIETQNNESATLEALTSAQQSLMTTYDAPPYVPEASRSAIPFIYFNGEYLISGATYDVSVLQGKTWEEIAQAMNDPSSAIAKGAIGAANGITAAICLTTHDQPASACSSKVIQDLQTQIKAQSTSSGGSTTSTSKNSSQLNP